MKITELVIGLLEILKADGDIEVAIRDDRTGNIVKGAIVVDATIATPLEPTLALLGYWPPHKKKD